MTRRVLGPFLLVLLGAASVLEAQTTTYRNPSTIEFECPDHATDDGHEVDIVRVSDNVVVQTLNVGDPAAVGTANNMPTVRVTLNVQPVTFGTYRFVVRAIAGTSESENSAPSPNWERVPGRPGNVVIIPRTGALEQ